MGLKIERDKSGWNGLQNVVSLLASGNTNMGFRYFTWEGKSRPDLAWTRDIVAELISAVTPFVESTVDKSLDGVPVKLDLVVRVEASEEDATVAARAAGTFALTADSKS